MRTVIEPHDKPAAKLGLRGLIAMGVGGMIGGGIFSVMGVAAITGWTVVVAYIGTLALYAFTFGAYASDLLGQTDLQLLRQALSIGIILIFMVINLRGTKTGGRSDDIIVYTKIALLGALAIAGLPGIEKHNLVPVLDNGAISVFMAAVLIFVAYEGFQWIS